MDNLTLFDALGDMLVVLDGSWMHFHLIRTSGKAHLLLICLLAAMTH